MARLKKPSVVVNLKTYRKGTGKNAERLVKKFSRIAKGNVIVAVQNSDLYRLKPSRVLMFAQHIDSIKYGAYTGHDLGEALKENGAKGVLINHSEDRVKPRQIKESVKIAKRLGLTTIVCIHKHSMAKQVARMKPDAIAIEPPELIGTGISVSKAKPYVVTKTVKAVKSVSRIDVLCGAGISTKQDVAKAKELGCKGVLVASAIVNNKRPEKLLKQFLEALK